MQPTFPISKTALAKKRRETVFGSLASWAALLPSFGIWAFLDQPLWLALVALITTLAGLLTYWKREITRLEPTWIAKMIAQSNSEQDELLHHQAQKFTEQNASQEALVLRHAIGLKQEIESMVHASDAPTNLKERLDNLVDQIAFALVDKLEDLKNGERENAAQEITDAIAHLEKTRDDLPQILNPTEGLAIDKQPDKLKEAIAALKEEAELANRVKTRLKNDWDRNHPASESSGNSSMESLTE